MLMNDRISLMKTFSVQRDIFHEYDESNYSSIAASYYILHLHVKVTYMKLGIHEDSLTTRRPGVNGRTILGEFKRSQHGGLIRSNARVNYECQAEELHGCKKEEQTRTGAEGFARFIQRVSPFPAAAFLISSYKDKIALRFIMNFFLR